METNDCLCFGWCRHSYTNKTKTQVYRSFFRFLPTTVVFNLLINTHASVLFLCLPPTSINLSVHSCFPPFFVIISTFIAPHQWSRSALLECFLLNVTCVPMVYPCPPAYLDPACVLIRTSHTLSSISTWSSSFQFSFAFSVSWWTFQFPETSHTHHFFSTKYLGHFLLRAFLLFSSGPLFTWLDRTLRYAPERRRKITIFYFLLYFWTMYETIKQAQIQHFLGVEIKSHRQTNIYRIYISCPFVCLSIWHCAAACGKW